MTKFIISAAKGIPIAFDYADRLDHPLVEETLPYVTYGFYSYHEGRDGNSEARTTIVKTKKITRRPIIGLIALSTASLGLSISPATIPFGKAPAVRFVKRIALCLPSNETKPNIAPNPKIIIAITLILLHQNCARLER